MKMERERLIFVTNDDGYKAKGFKALLDLAREFGRVVAVAPATPQSGRSQAVTMNEPLFLELQHEEEGLKLYSFSGTPVDCVKIAFDHLLLGEKVDLVISGINHDSNAAINVLYSGTMGAAIEGSFYGCPSVGLSVTDHDLDADFEAATYYGREIVGAALEMYARSGEPLCLNVNVPNIPLDKIKGVRVCRQCRGIWREKYRREQVEDGRYGFCLAGSFNNYEPDVDDTDEWALANDYVAVVPVQIDMTSYGQMSMLREHMPLR